MIARACYLLECAHFVHQCNRGQWPSWIRMNLPMYRPNSRLAAAAAANHQHLSAQTRRTQVLQLQATKMFYQWAEVCT